MKSIEAPQIFIYHKLFSCGTTFRFGTSPTMAMNQITDYIWLGSLMSLTAVKTMEQKKITHIITVLTEPVPLRNADKISHLQIDVDDAEDENIMKHFPESNKFIDEARSRGESVLVHCQAGISRSSTIVCAYIMRDQQCSAEEALKIVQKSRPIAQPNPMFMDQLAIYHQCGYTVSEDNPRYRRLLLTLDALRLSYGQPVGDIKYVSANTPTAPMDPTSNGQTFQLRCRKCSAPIAMSSSLLEHDQKETAGNTSCNHYFLEPIKWMQPELDQGKLEGKLLCPKCHCRLGAYHWQGSKCSCGRWITPAIEIACSRVDQMPVKAQYNGSL